MYSIAKSNNADFISCDYDMFPEEVKLKSHWYKQYQGTVDWQFVERNTQQWNNKLNDIKKLYLETQQEKLNNNLNLEIEEIEKPKAR